LIAAQQTKKFKPNLPPKL